MTPDIPGAADGTTGEFGRLGETLINYVKGTANQYSSAISKPQRASHESNDFKILDLLFFQEHYNTNK